MTTKIFGTLFAALFSPIALLVHAAVLIVTAPIAPFWVISTVVRKELRLRRERKQREDAARAFIKTVVAMRSAALSQYNPTNN